MEDTKKYFIQQYRTTEKCADILLQIFGDILFGDEGVYLCKYGYGIHPYARLINNTDRTAAKNVESHKNQAGKDKKDKASESESKLRIKRFTYSSFRFAFVGSSRSMKEIVLAESGRTPKYYLCKWQGTILKNTSRYIKVSGFILESLIFLITVCLSQGIAAAAIVEFIINIIRPHIFKIKAFEMCVLINLILEPEFNKTPFTVERRVLLVTSQIYVPYQQLGAIRTWAIPNNVYVEIVGFPTEWNTNQQGMMEAANYLQEIRSTIQSVNRYIENIFCKMPKKDREDVCIKHKKM